MEGALGASLVAGVGNARKRLFCRMHGEGRQRSTDERDKQGGTRSAHENIS